MLKNITFTYIFLGLKNIILLLDYLQNKCIIKA